MRYIQRINTLYSLDGCYHSPPNGLKKKQKSIGRNFPIKINNKLKNKKKERSRSVRWPV
jgi:hypothetical protein